MPLLHCWFEKASIQNKMSIKKSSIYQEPQEPKTDYIGILEPIMTETEIVHKIPVKLQFMSFI